jgi:hypothetical protein
LIKFSRARFETYYNIDDLSYKELLVLSSLVREAIERYDRQLPKDYEISLEAIDNWLFHVIG